MTPGRAASPRAPLKYGSRTMSPAPHIIHHEDHEAHEGGEAPRAPLIPNGVRWIRLRDDYGDYGMNGDRNDYRHSATRRWRNSLGDCPITRRKTLLK